MSMYNRFVHGLKSFVYEVGIAIVNYAGSIITSVVGSGLSSASDLLKSTQPESQQVNCEILSTLNNSVINIPNVTCNALLPTDNGDVISNADITRSMALGAAIVVPSAALLALAIDCYNDSDHLGDLTNIHFNQQSIDNPLPGQHSKFRSFIKRLWPLMLTYGSASIGGLILGFSSAEQQRAIFSNAALGSVAALLIGGGSGLAGREYYKKYKRNQKRAAMLNQQQNNNLSSVMTLGRNNMIYDHPVQIAAPHAPHAHQVQQHAEYFRPAPIVPMYGQYNTRIEHTDAHIVQESSRYPSGPSTGHRHHNT